MLVVPRELTTAAEIIDNAKSVRARLRPPPPPTKRFKPAPAPVISAPEIAEEKPRPLAPIDLPQWRPHRGLRIRMMIAGHYGINEQEIVGASRAIMYAKPRQIAMYLCVRHAGMSGPQTGRMFGNRDHSTVFAAIKRVRSRIEREPEFAWQVAEFVQRIEAMP